MLLRLMTALVLASIASACFPMPPDPARVSCLNVCGRDKDACLVAATTASAVQACDARSLACNAECSS